ncbi:tRNA1(Val) (adenine(37)-N6)-methyltransferase [Thermotoga profunda]|uniref:tRNA1(Val) (adenine(37)-N6)-methyltransferase n=1 Tax=Thermotoga profunda TaxID=1508420 RepID=UPI0005974261|nr:methyltransferase [Thermotoga profunda]
MENQRSSVCEFDEDLLRILKLPDVGKSYRPTHATTLLAWYSKPSKSQRRLIELGCATGAVCAYLALRYKIIVTAIEKDEFLFKSAQKTIEMNNLSNMTVHNISCSQVRDFFQAESFDMVVANPPHHLTNIPSPDSLRRTTRTADFQSAIEFIEATSYLLKNKGVFVYILPPTHLSFWVVEFTKRKLQPKKALPVYGSPKGNAQFFLLKGVKNGGIGLIIEPPLFLKRA